MCDTHMMRRSKYARKERKLTTPSRSIAEPQRKIGRLEASNPDREDRQTPDARARGEDIEHIRHLGIRLDHHQRAHPRIRTAQVPGGVQGGEDLAIRLLFPPHETRLRHRQGVKLPTKTTTRRGIILPTGMVTTFLSIVLCTVTRYTLDCRVREAAYYYLYNITRFLKLHSLQRIKITQPVLNKSPHLQV
jgi:hypothetical protein